MKKLKFDWTNETQIIKFVLLHCSSENRCQWKY